MESWFLLGREGGREKRKAKELEAGLVWDKFSVGFDGFFG